MDVGNNGILIVPTDLEGYLLIRYGGVHSTKTFLILLVFAFKILSLVIAALCQGLCFLTIFIDGCQSQKSFILSRVPIILSDRCSYVCK